MSIKIISTSNLDDLILKNAKINWLDIYDFDFVKISYLFNKNIVEKINKNTSPFVVTSQNAIKSIINLKSKSKLSLKTNKMYCINWVTSDLAKKNWFDVLWTWKNSFFLAKAIYDNNEKNLLHLTSSIRRNEIYDFLKTTQVTLTSLEIYNKKLDCIKINFPYSAILFFSPSQMDAFFKKNVLPLDVKVWCIWETSKKHLLEVYKIKNEIFMAENSKKETVVNEVINYFKNYEKR